MERIHLRGIDTTLIYFSKIQAIGVPNQRLLRVRRDHLIRRSYFIDKKIETQEG